MKINCNLQVGKKMHIATLPRAVLIGSNYLIHFPRKCSFTHNPHTIHTAQHPQSRSRHQKRLQSRRHRRHFMTLLGLQLGLHHRPNCICFYGSPSAIILALLLLFCLFRSCSRSTVQGSGAAQQSRLH